MNARPAPPLLSRRRMLERTAAGFGLLGLASVQGTPAAPAPPQRARRVIFLFMNGGPSHVDTFDPKPALARAEGKHPEGDLYKASKASGFMPSPFRFERHGQSGPGGQRDAPPPGEGDRRVLRRPLHADRRPQPRAGPDPDAHRQHPAHPPLLRIVADVRPGLGEPEPPRLRGAAPLPQHRGRARALEQQLPARPLPGHQHRHLGIGGGEDALPHPQPPLRRRPAEGTGGSGPQAEPDPQPAADRRPRPWRPRSSPWRRPSGCR